jgi:hypothetical protein
MSDLLEAIRIAVASGASPEARKAGAAACRALLTDLDGGVPSSAPLPLNASMIANVVSAMRGVPSEQLLDLAIAKLRSTLPADARLPPVKRRKFHIVPIPTSKGISAP